MCGIAGFVSPNNAPTAERITRTMTAALARRGPNAEGVEIWPDAALGHRRLAILDLSDAARQPMLSPGGNTGLVFNGCIYNFLDLRAELEQRGYTFRSNSDTEVLLHGYDAWGIDELTRRLRGMFAFAIWDQSRKTLFLVRDRLGVKPLMYVTRGDGIAFASTIEALRSAGLTGDVNPGAIIEFLEFAFVTDESAIFDNVRKLPPATILEWRRGAMTQRVYWTLPSPDHTKPIGFEEAVERTEELLVESVRLRLCADVPIGVLLSGGIDSALVCWAMAKLNANIKTFTVAAPGDEQDEAEAAQETAKILGLPNEIVPLPQSRPALIDELVEAYSEPFAPYSAQALLLVSRAVRNSATVLLTGDGGDDVFIGYPFMRNAWLAERMANRIPAPLARLWSTARGVVSEAGLLRRVRRFLDYSTAGLSAHAHAHDGLPWYEERELFGERLQGLRLWQREMAPSFESARKLLTNVLDYHRKMHFTSEFMQKVDGGTMYHSLEARSPFLDQKMWEFAAGLPFDVRMHNGQLKAILREIVRRRVSPQVAARKKQGFTVPVERWLADRWSSALNELRGSTLLEQQGWIQPGRLSVAVDEALKNRFAALQLWYLLVLERWLQRSTREQITTPPGPPAAARL